MLSKLRGVLTRRTPPPASPASAPYYPAVMGYRPPSGRPLTAVLPASMQRLTAPFVSRVPNRDGICYLYSYGAAAMPQSPPWPGGADGQVYKSSFQPYVKRMTAWAPSARFMHMVFPRNYGLSFRSPAPHVQITGGPGPGRMGVRPIFSRIQRIPRATRTVPTYDTQSAGR
jgi:hypothetical protein